jgi:hypothetical protein
VLESNKGLLAWNTINMAKTLMPQDPGPQMDQIDVPLGLWMGECDEILNTRKVTSFASRSRVIVKGANHLRILVCMHNFLGLWIQENL